MFLAMNLIYNVNYAELLFFVSQINLTNSLAFCLTI